MKTINFVVYSCRIILFNECGKELRKFIAQCFRRSGAQNRFVTGKSRWNLDVVNGGVVGDPART